MSMLGDFTETQNSDNRVFTLPTEKIDDIVIGATCTHSFSLGFKYSEYVVDSEIIYKLGLSVVLTKTPEDYKISYPTEGSTYIELTLSPADTIKFVDNCLDTEVQMKLVNINGETLYNIPTKLVVKKPLDIA